MNSVTLLLLLVTLFANNAASVVVETRQGMVRGEYLQAVIGNKKYASFKGIPFAKPPIGDLRFMAPRPPASWNGIRNATQHGPVCVQLSIYNLVDTSGSEDCLYLNVYTPEVKPKKLRPVMFFIHGGGFQSGSGDSDRYGPDYLITQDVVVVTSNHRLGALGFLVLNTKDVPGNAGMKDQVAALRWVQKNIANFGGDPDQVTIFGQSTGGACIGFHNLSPMSKGLYKRGIAMSGSPYSDFLQPFEAKRTAFRIGQQLGFWTRDVQKLLKFLRSVPAEKFLGLNPVVLKSEDPKVSLRQLIFTPVVERDFGDERFLVMSPINAMECGLIHDVDIMIGHTAIEAIIRFIFSASTVPEIYTNYTEMLVPRAILENIPPADMFSLADKIHKRYFGDRQIDNNVGKEFINYLSDASFNYAITKFAKKSSAFIKTFVYKFSKLPNFPRHANLQNEFGTAAAIHEDDLLYVLYPKNVTIDTNSEDYKVIKTTSALFANFAKYGNPTPTKLQGVKWPQYDDFTGSYLDINNTLIVRKHLNENMVAFWDSIYQEAGLGF